MANKNTLKGYFETGDIPNQSQYQELIDSNLNLNETGTQILVGTLSSSFLEVENHITASGNISSSGTGSFAYGHFAHDVGIGVAPTGLAALQVRDITPDTHTSVLIDSTGGANKDVNLSLSSSAQTWRIKQYAQGAVGTGQYELQIADVNNANAKVVRIATGQSSNTLVLSGSNVGIGQLNPGEKLEVVGNISASGNIIATGKIGIGTSSPNEALVVRGASYAANQDGGIAIQAGSEAGSYWQSAFKIKSDGDGIARTAIESTTGANAGQNLESISISTSGKVGIGTTSTNVPEVLTVVGNISASGTITANTLRLSSTTDATPTSTGHSFQSGPTTGVNIVINGNEIMARNNGSTSVLYLQHSGGNLVTNNGGGNLGIGSMVSPAERLTVNGNISGSGNLKIDGSQVDFANLPTSDPGVAGRLYNDSGTVKISL